MRLSWCVFWCAILASTFCAAEARTIDADRPLYLFPVPGNEALDALSQADAVVAAWQSLPDSVHAHAALLLDTPYTDPEFYDSRFQAVLQELEFRRIPVVLHVARGDASHVAPLEEMERWLATYTQVQGIYVSQFAFDTYAPLNRDDARWLPAEFRGLRDLLRVTALADRHFFMELGGHQWLRLMSQSWAQDFLNEMSNSAEHVTVLADSRGTGQLSRISSLMGLWLEGRAGNWGVTITDEVYTAARFQSPGEFGAARADTKMPPALYRAQLLVAASAGATVYRFSPTEMLQFSDVSPEWAEAIAPTLRDLTRNRAIAQKSWIQRDAHVAFRLNESSNPVEFRQNLADLDGVHHAGFLIHGAYGMELPGQIPEFIPNQSRSGWIPVLTPFASDEVLATFDEVVLPGAMLDAAAWRELLSTYYPETPQGDALVRRVGNNWYVFHTRENHYAPQQFVVPGLPAPVRGITGERTGQGIQLSWPFREGDLSYTVMRKTGADEHFEVVALDTELREYLDPNLDDPDVVFYAVTALTQEKESLSGTVNFGDYRLYSAVESRVEEVLELRNFETRGSSRPLPSPLVDERSTELRWTRPFEAELDAELQRKSRMALATLKKWFEAFRNEDADAMAGLFAESGAILSNDLAGASFETFFERFDAGPVHWQVRNSSMDYEGNLTVNAYIRFTGVERMSDARVPADREVAFPAANGGEVSFVFTTINNSETGAEELRLLGTTPPVPDFIEMISPRG